MSTPSDVCTEARGWHGVMCTCQSAPHRPCAKHNPTDAETSTETAESETPMMESTNYEIWAERDGKKRQVNPSAATYSERMLNAVREQVAEYNAEEAENARMEMRPVRTRYFVVKAVIARSEV